jgi:hypothetical protein
MALLIRDVQVFHNHQIFEDLSRAAEVRGRRVNFGKFVGVERAEGTTFVVPPGNLEVLSGDGSSAARCSLEVYAGKTRSCPRKVSHNLVGRGERDFGRAHPLTLKRERAASATVVVLAARET